MSYQKRMSRQEQLRVVVVANKNWEVDPLVGVLLCERARPAALSDFRAVSQPLIGSPGPSSADSSPTPRIVFKCGGAVIEVWCLQDLMNPAVSGSSSAEKARVLPRVFATGRPPDVVVAFGTAGMPNHGEAAGVVVVGSRCLVHDPRTRDAVRYTPKVPGEVSVSNLPPRIFRNIDANVRFPAEGRFLPAPLAGARPPVLFAGPNWIALSVVNVTNYDDYVWTDAEALAAFEAIDARLTTGRPGSLETTHGLIRELAEPARFMFVSGISDAIPFFDTQVVPRVYAQNFVAAHNAGVALAWLLPELVAAVEAEP